MAYNECKQCDKKFYTDLKDDVCWYCSHPEKPCEKCNKNITRDNLCYDCRYPLKQCEKCNKKSTCIIDGLCYDCRCPTTRCPGCHKTYLSKSCVYGKCSDCVETECSGCKNIFKRSQIKNGKCFGCIQPCKECGKKTHNNLNNDDKCSECIKIACTECGCKYDPVNIIEGKCRIKCAIIILGSQEDFEDLVKLKIQIISNDYAECGAYVNLVSSRITPYESLKAVKLDYIIENANAICDIDPFFDMGYTWKKVIRYLLNADLPKDDYVGGGSI